MAAVELTKIQSITSQIKVTNNKDTKLIYTFYEDHNALYTIFGEQTAKKISNFFNSKPYRIVLFLSVICYNTLNKFSWGTLNTKLHLIYSISFSILLWIPFLIFSLFTIEKTAWKYLKHSFEVWFKTITAICHFIAIFYIF